MRRTSDRDFDNQRSTLDARPMRWFISIRYFLTHKRQSLVCIAGVTISVTNEAKL